MPEPINLSKLYHDQETQWLARVIIGMMEDPKKNWPRAIKPDGSFDDQAEAEICLTIDGVEVSLLDTLKAWSDSFDEQLKSAVQDGIEQTVANRLEVLTRATEAYVNGLALHSKDETFWVVMRPGVMSTVKDILFETNLVGLCKQVRGGLDEDNILAVFALEFEEQAEAYAQQAINMPVQRARPKQ